MEIELLQGRTIPDDQAALVFAEDKIRVILPVIMTGDAQTNGILAMATLTVAWDRQQNIAAINQMCSAVIDSLPDIH